MKNKYALALHGGSGTILRESLTTEEEKAYRDVLEGALDEGLKLLSEGEDSLNVVEFVVRTMEDSPLFNAGKGSVYTHEGTHEMDAAVMRGRDREYGAIAGVSGFRNPISVARKVMEDSEFAFLIGKGAEEFADLHRMERAEKAYFDTALRKAQLEDAIRNATTQLDHSVKDEKFGTVGAVALDAEGNLAAATSTGGITNKRYGRVGDSPIAGAGVYADELCAVSCTGWGEYYLRTLTAYQVSTRMRYADVSIQEASLAAITDALECGGSGGLIAIGKDGSIALPFNSEGMYRASGSSEGEKTVAIYKDEQT